MWQAAYRDNVTSVFGIALHTFQFPPTAVSGLELLYHDGNVRIQRSTKSGYTYISRRYLD